MRQLLLSFLALCSVSTLVANLGFLAGLPELKFLKELLFACVCLLALFKWKKLSWNSLFGGLALVVWAIVSVLWTEIGIKELAYGLRYEVSFVVLFYAAYLLGIKKKQSLQLLRRFVSSYYFLCIIALVIWVFGSEWMVYLGYRPDWSTFYVGQATAFCQKIEQLNICRMQGFVSGPNVFGLFSLMIIALARYINHKNLRRIQAVLIGCIVLSFSRSAILAAITYFTLEYSGGLKSMWELIWKNKFKTLGLSLIVCTGLLAFRGGSNSEHLIAWMQGWSSFLDAPVFGHGLNFSGPASRFGGVEFIPESWFLQVANNLGVIGLGLFAWFLQIVYKNTPSKVSHFIVALCVPLALLHSLEDAGFAYSFAISMGLIVNLQVNEAS